MRNLNTLLASLIFVVSLSGSLSASKGSEEELPPLPDSQASRAVKLNYLDRVFPYLPFDELGELFRELDSLNKPWSIIPDYSLGEFRVVLLQSYLKGICNQKTEELARYGAKHKLQLCELVSLSAREADKYHPLRTKYGEPWIERLTEPNVQNLLSLWFALMYRVADSNYSNHSLGEWVSVQFGKEDKWIDFSSRGKINVWCHDCSQLEVEKLYNKGTFKVRAAMHLSHKVNNFFVWGDVFEGTFDSHRDKALILRSGVYDIRLEFQDEVMSYIKDKARFTKVIASSLHQRGVLKSLFGWGLRLQVSPPHRGLVYLADLKRFPIYLNLLAWEPHCTPFQSNQEIEATSDFLYSVVLHNGYGTPRWSAAVKRLNFYDDLIEDKKIDADKLMNAFPPLPKVRRLIKNRPAYAAEYKRNLLCFLTRGHRLHNESCKTSELKPSRADYLRRLQCFSQYEEKNNVKGLDFDHRLSEIVCLGLQAEIATPYEEFWEKTFGFDVSWIRSLCLLRSIGNPEAIMVPDNKVDLYLRSKLPDEILEIYLKVLPWKLSRSLPRDLYEAYVTRAVDLVCLLETAPTIDKARDHLNQSLDEIEKKLRDFPSLPQHETGRAAIESLVYGRHQVESFFDEALLKLFEDRNLRMPRLAPAVEKSPYPSEYTERMFLGLRVLELYKANRGKRLEDVAGEYFAYLRTRFDQMMAKGWLGPAECEKYIFDTEITELNPVDSLTTNLDDWPRVKQMLEVQTHCLEKRRHEDLEKLFYRGVAGILVQEGSQKTVQQACEAYFPIWLPEYFNACRVCLPDKMIDASIHYMLENNCSCIEALAQHVPQLYTALLGKDVAMFNPEETSRQVAQDLLMGKSFRDCHRLKFKVSAHDWFEAILELREMSIDIIDQVKAIDLDKWFAKVEEYEWWRMSDVEIAKRLRTTTGVHASHLTLEN